MDRQKVEAVKRRESKQKFEERKQKLKDFFGFGAAKPPVKFEAEPRPAPRDTPVQSEVQSRPRPGQSEKPLENVKTIQGRQSRVRIFDEQPLKSQPLVESRTPEFYQMQRGGQEPPKISNMVFKKKAKPEKHESEARAPRIEEKAPEREQPKPERPRDESPGFFERIKNYFKAKPKEEEKKPRQAQLSDHEEQERYVQSIRNRPLNFDYSRPFEQQVPRNVNN